MYLNISKLAAVAGVSLFALMGAISLSGPASAAEGVRRHNGVSVNIGKRTGNRGRHLRQRSFSDNGNYGNNSYGRRHHRRNRGLGFGGISINLGDIDSSCRYSYRKWQTTGSRYWRSRYYDCVG